MRILVVDDIHAVQIVVFLDKNRAQIGLPEQTEFDTAESMSELRGKVRERWDIVLLDACLPEEPNAGPKYRVSQSMKLLLGDPRPFVVLLSGGIDAEEHLEEVHQFVEGGALQDFIPKDQGLALTLGWLKVKLRRAAPILALRAEPPAPHGMVAVDPRFARELDALLSKVAPMEDPILILGEPGTGKCTVAKAVHAASPRANGDWIPYRCTANPRVPFETTLFGGNGVPGLIPSASDATLFLRDIECLSMRDQKTLNDFLVDRKFRAEGDAEELLADVCVLAATSADVDALVGKGEFRSDLLSRLALHRFRVPSLRDRRTDIRALARAFSLDESVPEPEESILEAFDAYSWPGNVSELRIAIAQIAARFRVDGRAPTLEDLATQHPGSPVWNVVKSVVDPIPPPSVETPPAGYCRNSWADFLADPKSQVNVRAGTDFVPLRGYRILERARDAKPPRIDKRTALQCAGRSPRRGECEELELLVKHKLLLAPRLEGRKKYWRPVLEEGYSPPP